MPEALRQMIKVLMKVLYFDKTPPYAAIAAAKLTKQALETAADPAYPRNEPSVLKFPDGETELVGVPLMARYFARLDGALGLYGKGPLEACEIDTWLEFSQAQLVPGGGLPAALQALDSFLALRTYLVGYAPTIADLVAWSQLTACPQFAPLRKTLRHVGRWYDTLSDIPELRATLAEHDPSLKRKATQAQLTDEQTGKKKGEGGSFDIDLPGAVKGKVVTRFPPEPSGYLHIGHAKAALLNEYFARHYEGQLIVRFDDTNPSKEKDEFVDNILQDIATLGIKFDRLTYTSDYFPQMMDLATRLINSGLLYADDTPVDQMREERNKCVESACRGRPVAENLRLFQEMIAASEEGQKNCLRLKIDMKSDNGCLRDPVAWRCNLTPHHRTGTKFKVYPTYDFACPFVDAFEGVTHALRTSEYKDREAQYYWCLDAYQKVWPELPRVHIWDYSRLNFVHTVLSKRKLQWFVDTKRVENWSDPRFPTVQGVMRRGMTREALREFILSQGASRNCTVQEWDKIWTINKKIIDPVVPRHTVVLKEGAVTVRLVNGPGTTEYATVPRHRQNASLGDKAQCRSAELLIDQADAAALTEGEEVTLMGWGNCFMRGIRRSPSGAVESIDAAELHPQGDFKKTKLKLTWLAKGDDLVAVRLVDYGYLITKAKVEDTDDFQTLVNTDSRRDTMAWGEGSLRTLSQGDVLQLERKGYYRADRVSVKAGSTDEFVFFSIPDGRSSK